MREDLEALRKRGTFEFVDRPRDRRVIQNRWVFNEKPDGRLKARLVAKDFTQIEGCQQQLGSRYSTQDEQDSSATRSRQGD